MTGRTSRMQKYMLLFLNICTFWENNNFITFLERKRLFFSCDFDNFDDSIGYAIKFHVLEYKFCFIAAVGNLGIHLLTYRTGGIFHRFFIFINNDFKRFPYVRPLFLGVGHTKNVQNNLIFYVKRRLLVIRCNLIQFDLLYCTEDSFIQILICH